MCHSFDQHYLRLLILSCLVVLTTKAYVLLLNYPAGGDLIIVNFKLILLLS